MRDDSTSKEQCWDKDKVVNDKTAIFIDLDLKTAITF